MSSLYSVRQMNQLGDALEEMGYTVDDVTKMRSRKYALKQFKGLLIGTAKIKPIDHLINLSADPFVPEGWQVVEHRKGGQFKFDPAKLSFYLSPDQQKRRVIMGEALRAELSGKTVVNANLLDYLLAHQELIPEEWKGKAVFFWGTICRDPDGDLCVRYLNWFGGQWNWSCDWLAFDWRALDPALLLAS